MRRAAMFVNRTECKPARGEGRCRRSNRCARSRARAAAGGQADVDAAADRDLADGDRLALVEPLEVAGEAAELDRGEADESAGRPGGARA
jgi:uncharacterized Zn ribbon protein